MEGNIATKIKKNWRNIKESLTGNHKEVRDQLFQNGILGFNDLEMVDSIPTPIDKVDMMMMTMMRGKEFLMFINTLEQIGFEKLCKEIKETGLDLITKPIIHTKKETKSTEVAGFADVLNRLAKLELREKENDANLQEVKKEMGKISTDHQELKVKFGKLAKRHERLKGEYAIARSSIDNLTTRLNEKNLQNRQLKKSLDSARSEIEELKQKDVSIQNQQEKMIQFKADSACHDEQIRKIIEKTDEEKEKLKMKECELSNMSERIESLKREILNIQGNAKFAAGEGKRSGATRWKIPGKY